MSKCRKLLLPAVLALAFAIAPLASLSAASLSGPHLAAPSSSSSALGFTFHALSVAGFIAATIKVKDTASIAKKFASRASAASGDYKEGVAGAGADWEANTKAASEVYKQSVIEAANAGRFEKGVAAAGAARYTKKATELGPSRFSTGVAAATDDFARGVGPYLDALKSIDLPPRKVKGQNAERANIVATRLRAMKVGK